MGQVNTPHSCHPAWNAVLWEKKAKELSMMLFAKKIMRYVTLSDSELRLAKYALLQFRNALIAKGLPTEDVNGLLLKLYK
jgi:hypothetical protein